MGREELGWEIIRSNSFRAFLVFFSISMMESKEWSRTRWSFLGREVD